MVKSSGQKFDNLLLLMYKMLDKLLSRREDYKKLTFAKVTGDYSLQFCTHSWVENEHVIKRAAEIWPNMVEITKFWKKLLKSNTQEEICCELPPVLSDFCFMVFYQVLMKELTSMLIHVHSIFHCRVSCKILLSMCLIIVEKEL